MPLPQLTGQTLVDGSCSCVAHVVGRQTPVLQATDMSWASDVQCHCERLHASRWAHPGPAGWVQGAGDAADDGFVLGWVQRRRTWSPHRWHATLRDPAVVLHVCCDVVLHVRYLLPDAIGLELAIEACAGEACMAGRQGSLPLP
jgi:hypothetical protein